MFSDHDVVVAANLHFYQALSVADIDAMRSVWHKSQEVRCLHPGWQAVEGHDNILRSWSAIFVNQGPLHIWPTNIEISVENEIATVECIENIDARQTEAGAIMLVRATNTFRRTSGGWKMVSHAAVAAPDLAPKIAARGFAEN